MNDQKIRIFRVYRPGYDADFPWAVYYPRYYGDLISFRTHAAAIAAADRLIKATR